MYFLDFDFLDFLDFMIFLDFFPPLLLSTALYGCAVIILSRFIIAETILYLSRGSELLYIISIFAFSSGVKSFIFLLIAQANHDNRCLLLASED
jgi:hypothetical protein